MMLKVGDKVSNPVLLYAVGGYVIFPIILSLITVLIILKFFPNFVKRDKDPQIPSYFLWIVITIYGSIFGVMSILRYLSFHNGVFDFGVFDHIVWNIAKQGNFRRLASGHFFPVLIVYALFYKLYSSGMVLLIAQTVAMGLSALPLYYIAKGKLGNNYYALLIVVIYFLYSPVQYNNVFDFHTDHLIILIMFLGFYFLEKRNALAFVLICLAGLTIKEPLILSMAAMGLYAISRYRMYKSGSFVLVGSLLFFFWVINAILPQTTGTSYGGGFGGSFSYLGSDVFEIGRTLVSHPWIILKEMNVWKIGYLVFIFFPLLLLPSLSPLSLIPTIPAIAISLLSRLPTYYWIQQHYTASVIAPVFISLIYGVGFLGDRSHHLNRWFKKFFSVNLTRNSVLRISLWTILVVSLYYNVVLSPSPISLFFWKKIDGRYYHRTSYVAKERDRVLHEAIKKFIPQQASVTSQNSVYNAHLFHRTEYYLFPEKIGEVDYVVLDRKRTHFVGDIRVDENEYEKEFTRVLKTHKIVFSYDGMYIFKKI